jgi:hypothetical protein
MGKLEDTVDEIAEKLGSSCQVTFLIPSKEEV